MTVAEAEKYFETLSPAEAQRYNLLVSTYLKLGKPIEGAYQAAKTIMEEENE